MYLKQKTCSITGPSPNHLHYLYDERHPDCLRLKVGLIGEIDRMRQKGRETFLTGMAQGPELWCAETVLDLKKAYPDETIRLVAVIPYEEQANNWKDDYRERYYNILARADDVITLQTRYSGECMRNHSTYLVEASSHLIAVYNGSGGRTRAAVDHAIKKGLDVIIINPDTLKREHIPPAINANDLFRYRKAFVKTP